MSIYIIGAKKGLGKYLTENIKSIPINRNNFNLIKNSNKNVFIICANNKNKYPDYNQIYDFYSDNILLIQKLLKLRHKQIIYMSSIEVYNSDNQFEKSNIICETHNPYALCKIISENLIINKTKKFTILRMCALLGKYSNNVISRTLLNGLDKTTLSKKSIFNYILYEDILLLIKKLIKDQKTGVLNVVSKKNISLEQAINLTNKKIKFGKYKYITHKIDNNKINRYTNLFNKTSKQNLIKFINDNMKIKNSKIKKLK